MRDWPFFPDRDISGVAVELPGDTACATRTHNTHLNGCVPSTVNDRPWPTPHQPAGCNRLAANRSTINGRPVRGAPQRLVHNHLPVAVLLMPFAHSSLLATNWPMSIGCNSLAANLTGGQRQWIGVALVLCVRMACHGVGIRWFAARRASPSINTPELLHATIKITPQSKCFAASRDRRLTGYVDRRPAE